MDNPFAEKIEEFSSSQFVPKRYRCTVVSLLPWSPPPEEKPHLLPSTFRIPAADPKTGIGVIHVGEAVYFQPNPFDDRNTRVPVSPNEVARSIVDDYINGQMALDEDTCPGVFWVEGELTEADVIKFFKRRIEEYKVKQTNWFKALVNMADADFTKNKNRMAISDIQREAARAIGYKADWVDFNVSAMDMKQCPFCKSTISVDAIKCPVCSEVVDATAYKQLQKTMGGA